MPKILMRHACLTILLAFFVGIRAAFAAFFSAIFEHVVFVVTSPASCVSWAQCRVSVFAGAAASAGGVHRARAFIVTAPLVPSTVLTVVIVVLTFSFVVREVPVFFFFAVTLFKKYEFDVARIL